MKVIHLGNINGKETHGGFAGDFFSSEGLCPTLNTMGGGYADAFRSGVCIQAVGDRGRHTYSIKPVAFTIPANPMSDRGQMVIEIQYEDSELSS